MKSIDKIKCIALNIKFVGALLLLMIIVSTLGAQTVSQERESHHKIRSFITEKYPEAKSIWILDECWGYRTTFKAQDGKYVSSFSIKNDWLQTERKVTMADIPQSVKLGFESTKYNKTKVLTAKKLILPQEPSPLYLLEVRATEPTDPSSVELANVKDYKLYFTTNGQLAKEEVQPGDPIQSIPCGGQ